MSPLHRTAGDPLLSVETAPAYEFVMSMVTTCEHDRDVLEVGPTWFETMERQAGPQLWERVREFTQGTGEGFLHLVGLVYDTPAPRSVDALIEHLEETRAAELLLHLVGYYEYHVRRKSSPAVMRAAVEGDRSAIEELLATAEEYPDWRSFLARTLDRGGESIKRELIGLMTDWHASVWRHEAARLMPILERDVETKRALAAELPFETFVEQATNGVRYVPRPDIDRLVLVPTYLNRPWVSYSEMSGAMIMVYPVADETIAAVSDAPPLRLVRLTKALADEKRLRILRALAEEPRSLIQLAELFEVPKTSMHHHMITLRSAGLVSVTADKSEYRLRTDALPSLAQLLGGYITPPGSGRAEPRDEDAVDMPAHTRPNRRRATADATSR